MVTLTDGEREKISLKTAGISASRKPRKTNSRNWNANQYQAQIMHLNDQLWSPTTNTFNSTQESAI
jgi:hypothetical protein